jgi:hypothetical protein
VRSVGATTLPEAKEETVRPKERWETPYGQSLPPLAIGWNSRRTRPVLAHARSTAWAT